MKGSVYRRRLRDGQLGEIYWIKYYLAGKPVRESTSTDKKSEAQRILNERLGRVATGQPIMPRADRTRYEEAAEDLRNHYRSTGSRDMEEAEYRLKHLGRFFGQRRIAAIGQPEATGYALERQQRGASNGTINRELAVLNRLLRLAYENGKLLRLPIIRKLKENGPRQGFFERAQYEAVRRHLSADLQVAAAIAYTYGWRTQSEVLTLERRQLDMEAGTIRLEPGTTKNDEGRLVYLTPELKALLTTQLERVETLQKRLGRIVPHLFPYLTGMPRIGERRRDYRKAWATACEAAGVAGRLRHDFRRTAVRNMVNAGVPERVAMKVTGHKTRAVFDRYHIVSPSDLQDAARKLAWAATAAVQERDGHTLGTSGGRRLDSRSLSV